MSMSFICIVYFIYLFIYLFIHISIYSCIYLFIHIAYVVCASFVLLTNFWVSVVVGCIPAVPEGRLVSPKKMEHVEPNLMG